MPTITLHPRVSSPTSLPNPLPQVLQTPTGLAILELQGTINLPSEEAEARSMVSANDIHDPSIPTFETPVGRLMFPDYSPQTAPDDTKWMKRVYLYVGRYQRMTGEVKKLVQPLALVQRRQKETNSDSDDEELEVVEVIKYKLFFKNRPEPVNDS
ncbi:chromosome transmission fidelity protein 8 [Aspergillus bertholletiae]|uniref:Chromosome transmission fidelity protein 8 n=1 Tax=Aspergillus bertholletiae TaxID=1226010 RepID=A0A5N7AY45_9EURO|nr:chromosome transmission fidelity protein 8 [Aspergillus bertholletiae]